MSIAPCGLPSAVRRLPSPVIFLALCFSLPFIARADNEGGFLGLHEAGPRFVSEDEFFSAGLNGIADLEGYFFQEDAPGLLYGHSTFINPRLTLFGDAAVGERLSFFAQARADRAFDPATSGHDVRLDELFVRYDLIREDDTTLSLQLGKFATPLGNWVPRHDSMHSAFIRAPIPYDRMTTLSDNAAPAGNMTLISQRDRDDAKETWVPMIWGPVYHTGAMAAARAGRFDLRAALTNAAPSERPEAWDPDREDAGALAASARLGWTPFLGFKTGINYAAGPWLRHKSDGTLPTGRHREDYPQKLAGVDLEYGIGHLVLFGEAYACEWKAPWLSDDPHALAYYLEAKYSLRPGLYVAARWGEILYNEITDAAGNETPWDRNARRFEVGAGYFIETNLLARIQYEINPSNGPNDQDDMLSMSTSLSF